MTEHSRGDTHDVSDTHYSRVEEMQPDASRVPFVHRNTIGRSGRTLMDAPEMEWAGNPVLDVYVYPRLDDGTAPKRTDEVPVPHPIGSWLEFVRPNLRQNHISDDLCILCAFVPVDEAHTVLFLRSYRGFVRVPVVRNLVNRATVLLDRCASHQDRRRMLTQRPRHTSLRMDEKPF